MSKAKVLVAMSGGVDSSVAAALLLEQGYDVVGCFMRLGSPGETFDQLIESETCDPRKIKIGHQGCCSINDAKDAQVVAAKLSIPLYILNFKRDFGRVIDYFVDEYNAGRTPNPCVRCNDWLKFGKLDDYARSIDAEFVATGHYARIDTSGPRPALLRGIDHTKDQSYVLFGQSLPRLTRMMLPVGTYTKPHIRALAQQRDLPVFDKPDSQEICFVPDMDYAGVIRRHRPDAMAPGPIRDESGKLIGQHEGHQSFTIGQRKGLQIAHTHPLYVIHKDPATNTVTVGPRDRLQQTSLIANRVNWFIDPPASPIPCTAKIRYNSPPSPAHVQATGPDELTITFDEPQFAIAPGQAAVCYDHDRVLGGGWIQSAS
jgi:tRNA-specific 2-thiouridylase